MHVCMLICNVCMYICKKDTKMYTHMQMNKHTLILQGFISQNIESLSNAGAPHLFVDMK